MLQKAFFKVDVVDRIYDTPVFEKTTPGAYRFTVPEEYNYVVIEYAGAGGGNTGETLGGKGSIKKEKLRLQQFHISGVIGASGGDGYLSSSPSSNGGAGYENGDSGQIKNYFGDSKLVAGGGGGSTSVVVNNLTYEASAGGGASYSGAGGKGGGQYGGTGGASNTGEGNPPNPGNNATDPAQIGLNSGDGYVKIWAGYDPYFKG